MEILLPTILIILIFIVAALELYLIEKWSSYYFHNGLIIYKKSFNINGPENLDVNLLTEKMGGILRGGMKFNKQPNGNIFFRERYFSWWPFSILMRGVIIIKNNSISILGRLNLMPIVFYVVFIAVFIYADHVDLTAVYVFVLLFFLYCIIYLSQIKRYNKIALLIEGK